MNWKNIAKWVGYFALMLVLVYFLEGWGIVGFLVFMLGMALFRAWKMRESLKMAMRQMECVIFGKPLDKDCWEKGEMKNTKVKVVWGKKKK